MTAIWTTASIADLAEKVGSGATPSGGEAAYKSAGIPLIRSMNVVFFGFKRNGLAFLDERQAAALDGATVRAQDVLLNITGASIGRVTLVPNDLDGARVNQHVCIIRPKTGLDARYLGAYLSSPTVQSMIWADNTGTTRQALTKQQILGFEVPLPPLAEQKRIADKLDTVLARVDAVNERLARVAPLLKRFRQSVLAAATSGRLTEDWRGTTGTDAAVNVDSIEDAGVWPFKAIPSSWTLQEMADCFTDCTDSAKKVPQAEYVTQGALPVVDQGEKLIGGFVNDLSKQSTARLPAIVFGDHTRCIKWIDFHFAQGADGVKVLSPKLGNARYGWVLLKALELPDKGYSRHFKYLKRSVFPVPPAEEQIEIVRRVETLFAFADRLEARLQAAHTAADRLTPSLLAKAFRGELVPQDPNDEPAAELLKRLATNEPAKVKRGRRPTTEP